MISTSEMTRLRLRETVMEQPAGGGPMTSDMAKVQVLTTHFLTGCQLMGLQTPGLGRCS